MGCASSKLQGDPLSSDLAPHPSNTPSSSSSPTQKKQSLSQRWKERHGVPEPKDENGRGLYSGKTTDELIALSRKQIPDGRVYMGEG
jgi:hypothetical protein